MKLLDVVKGLFTKEREPINPEDYNFMCPKCGNSRIGYFSGCINIHDVVNEHKMPKYAESAKCLDCGFRTKDYKDSNDGCLQELVRVHK